MTQTRRLNFLQLEDRLTPSNPSDGSPPGDPSIFGSGLGYSFTNWPASPLADIRLTTENTYPMVGPRGQAIRATEDWILRDPFPITDLNGQLTKIGGWYVVAGLATPRDDSIGTLRDFRYIISPDGVNWQEGGLLISANDTGPVGLGDQLFSGDFRYDVANNRLLIYYTPVQGSNAAEYVTSVSGPNMRQEIAIATATPVPTANGLTFTSYVDHGIKLRPDGNWYTIPEAANTETEVYAFRDPYFYRDPETGLNYLLFAANWGRDQTVGYPAGAVTGDQQFPDAGPHDVVAGRARNDGVVGVAVATDDTLLNWKLLPPVFGAVGVNEQLELPHIVYENGQHYLLMSTHNRTFVGDLKYDYPEGLYGFVADDFQGPWRPVNGTSLIFANPPEDELQTYAWKAADLDDGRATVLSFINKGNAGTVAPAVTIRFDGDRVVIDDYQSPTGAGLPQPTVLAFGVTPTAPAGSLTLPPPPAPQVPSGGLSFVLSGDAVVVFNADGSRRFTLPTFPGFTGSVQLASGDLNGDGTPDVVVAAGAGGGPHVRAFDGATGRELASFFAYDIAFTGGEQVAIADVTGDRRADIVTGAGAGGGPHVKVFDGKTFTEMRSFFAYDPNFTGGVNVTAGDLNADGFADIITGAGAGGGPHVKAFDGKTGAETRSFFAYDPAFAGGVSVFFDRTSVTPLVWTGAGPGGGPHVKAFDAAGNTVRSFFAGDPADTSGVTFGGTFAAGGQSRLVLGGSSVRTFTPEGTLLSSFAPFGGGVAPYGVSVLTGYDGGTLLGVTAAGLGAVFTTDGGQIGA